MDTPDAVADPAVAPPPGFQLDTSPEPAATLPAPPEGFQLDATPPTRAPDNNIPQMSQRNPTLMDRVRGLGQDLRTSGPVETILGRTPDEIAANPALESAPTTTDAGVMGLFQSKTPVVEEYDQPKTALEGLHNWAGSVVNSVASPGGIATLPLTGPAKIFGPIVQKALLLTFGAQGAKMTYDAAKDLVQKNYVPPPPPGFVADPDTGRNGAQTVMDVGNILAGALMMAGGKGALKGEGQPIAPPRPPAGDDWLPTAPPENPVPPPPPGFVADTPTTASTVQTSGAGESPAATVPSEVTPPSEPVPEVPAAAEPLPQAADTPAPAPPVATIPKVTTVAIPPSRIVLGVLDNLSTSRQPIPVSLLADSGIKPEALATGYQLNPAGTAYEFTQPAIPPTPEQLMARENVQTMADFRANKLPAAEEPGEVAPSEPLPGKTPPTEPATPLIPVDVTPADIKAAGDSARPEGPPDLLDTVRDYFPGGVKFDRSDVGEVVKGARGAAAELMSHTTGEPADQVLKSLHEDGQYLRLQTADDLADAMKAAGEQRITARATGGASARALAEQQKRTEAFEAALRPGIDLKPKTKASFEDELKRGSAIPIDRQSRKDFSPTASRLKNEPILQRQEAGEYNSRPKEIVVTHANEGVSHFAEERFSKGYKTHRFVFSKNGKGVGYLQALEFPETKDGDPLPHNSAKPAASKIHLVYTHPEFERRGIASKLVSAADNYFKTPLEAALDNSKSMRGLMSKLTAKSDRVRGDAPEPMPASALFPGDTFKLNGQPVTVEEHVSDAETGRPSHLRVSGAYGDQTIPVDATVPMDTGSLQSPSLTQSILFHLDNLKLDTRGQLHAFGLAPEVWNTLIDGIKLAVRGGAKLADAITTGIARLKASGAELKDFNEAAAVVHLNENFGVRQFGQQLQDASDITGALKGQVTNTLYERRPQEDDASYAQNIIKDVGGLDQAITVFSNEHRLPQPVRVALGMQILKGLDAGRRFNDAANFFDNHLAPLATDIGQGLAMFRAWASMSVEGKLVWARNKLFRAAKEMIDPVRPDIEAARVELEKQNARGIENTTADPQVQAGARQAITEAVAGSSETHAGVVMELTQPWASAKVILDMARAQVQAKANDLLTKQPRPIGFTAAQHMRAIMDDLAQRAADIAAGHYRGAEPGVPLRDKLVQRLGISTDAAGKLQAALDKEFARQVKAAQDALPNRIARQIERAKQGLPADATETAVDKSIRQQLATGKQKLGTLVRDHWTKVDATGAALKDKLMRQAGLTGDAATRLADLIQRRFEALTGMAKKSALAKVLRPVQRIARPQLVDRLIKFSNLGAFDSEKYWNALRAGLDLPEWNQTLRDRLAAIADRIAKIPGDRLEDAQRVQTEFLNEVEKAKGISNAELGLAFYMQNILSGVTTHVRVAIHTSAQMMGAVTAEMEQALVSGRLHDVPLIFEALARGTGKAFAQQKDIMRTGVVVGSKLQSVVPLSVLEQIRFGRAGGTTVKQGRFAKAVLESKAATLLNAWKYNGRLITAQHMLYFKPAEEMKIALLASRQARTEGLTGRAAVDRARQIAGYGAAQVRAAEAQSIREGLTGTPAKMRTAEILQAGIPTAVKENARDYALRQTFLNEPYGFVGNIAKVVQNAKANDNAAVALGARLIVPFTRIAANLFNEGLNYTPIGAARAALSRTELAGNKFADITPEVRDDLRKELYAKAALGSMLTTAIAFKAAQGLSQANPDFAVYGAGPANPQDKNAWRAAGGIPYSVKIGGRYVSYANTPANVMLAALGNYLDASRDAMLYKRPGALRLAGDIPLRTAAALVGMGKVIMEQPYLQSLLDVANLSAQQNPELSAKQAIQTAARTATSFVVPNLFRQLDRFEDPTAYDTKTLGGILTSQMPFVRQSGRPLLNALGQPIQSPVFGQLTGPANADPLVQTLTSHNFWPSSPDRNQTSVNGVPLDEDEFYTYMQARGQALARMLSQPTVGPMLDRLAQNRDNLTTRAATAANPIAKAAMTKAANGIQNEVLGRFEAAANKEAAAAVIRTRGY